MTTIHDLQSAGLTIQSYDPEEFEILRDLARTRPTVDIFAWMYSITKPADHPTFNIPPEYRISTLQMPMDASESRISFHFNENQWSYRLWDTIPGPRTDEFYCMFRSLEEALAAVHTFYFGHATIVDVWVLPFHWHPEINQETFLHALQQTTTINTTAYQEHLRYLREQIGYPHHWEGWPDAVRCQFIECRHCTDTRVRLCVRRDMQEAFIVEE
jgi:hypothetical protein